MKNIDEVYIKDILGKSGNSSPDDIQNILDKAKSLQRLSLAEAATLLQVEDAKQLELILAAATEVKEAIYGKRVVLFVPLYISNICNNDCLYCAFRSKNKGLERKALSPIQITKQVEALLERGHKRVLLVAGEAAPHGKDLADYYVDSIKAIYAAEVGLNKIKRVNINCAPLSIEGFRKLKAAGIGTYQLFQETYHEETYRKVHVGGPKSDPNKRIQAIDDAFAAGIDDVGLGVLYGLYDYKFETLALLQHVEHLEKVHGVGPHTISVPRIEPAAGSELSENIPYKVTDNQFKKLIAVLRLAVPYTGLILSTRESAELRNQLFSLGISQISAESNTTPGGYADNKTASTIDGQFSLSDHRSLDEVIDTLLQQGHIPSFCAACYRSNRTGQAFMNMAKPGTIKGCCSMNALITLKEYIDDFGSAKVKQEGYDLINKMKGSLSVDEQAKLEDYFTSIDKGERDKFL